MSFCLRRPCLGPCSFSQSVLLTSCLAAAEATPHSNNLPGPAKQLPHVSANAFSARFQPEPVSWIPCLRRPSFRPAPPVPAVPGPCSSLQTELLTLPCSSSSNSCAVTAARTLQQATLWAKATADKAHTHTHTKQVLQQHREPPPGAPGPLGCCGGH